MLVEIENKLLQHTFVDDCYVVPHPKQDGLVVLIGLSINGIDYFRENGRQAVLQQLLQSLCMFSDHQQISLWYLTDKLPRNDQFQIEQSVLEQLCIERNQDPIWLDTHFTSDTAYCYGKVPVALDYFNDHFAQFPLVPGVVELQWISEQIQHLLHQDIQCTSINKLKYQRFLRPNDEFELRLKWSPEKRQVSFAMQVNNEMCCSGIAQLI